MFAALAQLYSMFGMLFAALEKFASALNHLGGIADESAAAMADEAKIDRQVKLNALNRRLEASKTADQPTIN